MINEMAVGGAVPSSIFTRHQPLRLLIWYVKWRNHYAAGASKTIPDTTDAVCRSVRTINKTGAAKGIMRLPHRWERVLHNVGEYIEGLWKYELCRCAVSKVTAALPKL